MANTLLDKPMKMIRQAMQGASRTSDYGGDVPDTKPDTWATITNCYQDAATNRKWHEWVALEGLLYSTPGSRNQWLMNVGGTFTNGVDQSQNIASLDTRVWDVVTDDFLSEIRRKQLARCVQSKPSCYAAAYTASARDTEAARISRAIIAHCATKLDNLLPDYIDQALAGTTAILEVYWDAKALAMTAVGQYPDGSPIYAKAPIGDVKFRVRPILSVYVDPRVSKFEDAEWIDAVSICTMDYGRSKWGKAFADVKPGVSDLYYANIDMQVRSIGQDMPDMAIIYKDSVIVHEYWLKPRCNPLYPNGRYVIAANGTIVVDEEWPYEREIPSSTPCPTAPGPCQCAGGKCPALPTIIKDDVFPFVPLQFVANHGTVWGGNMFTAAISMQRALNALLTGLQAQAINEKPVVLANETSELQPGDIQNMSEFTVVPWRGGTPPSYFTPPPPGAYRFSLVEYYGKRIYDKTGYHELLANEKTVPNLSGTAIELLNSGDLTGLASFIQSGIEPAYGQAMEFALNLYRQFGGSSPRLMALDDTNTPDKESPQYQEIVVDALKEGACRVVIEGGSAMPKNSAARLEQYERWYKMGIFGPEGSPTAAKFFAKLCSEVRSDKDWDELVQMLAQAEAQQQALNSPAVVQALKQQQAEQAMQAQQAAQAQELAFKQHMAEVLEAVKVHGQMQTETLRSQADIATNEADTANKLKVIAAQAAQPSISFAGKLDPQAVASFEKTQGWDTPDDDQLDSMAVPPKPTTPPKSGGNASTPPRGK